MGNQSATDFVQQVKIFSLDDICFVGMGALKMWTVVIIFGQYVTVLNNGQFPK